MKKQYIISERAHFMCPNMHFGILAEIRKPYNHEKLYAALNSLAEAHPFLRSVIESANDGKKLCYDVSDKLKITVCEKQTQDSMWNDYIEIGKNDWNVFENGLLKVYIYPNTEGFQALFIAHHLLCDGRGLLELVCEFSDIYVKDIKPGCVEENLILSMDDLPEGSNLPSFSKWLIQRVNKKWIKENKRVSYDTYAEFAQHFAKDNPVGYAYASLDKPGVENMWKQCRENSVSVNDLLMARLYTAANTRKIIIAVDIRDKLSRYNKGAMGNYASAMGIVYEKSGDDAFETAKKLHCLVKQHISDNRKLMLVLACYLSMNAELIDAAAISALGGFESKAAKFAGGTMFGFAKRNGISLTNLGSVSSDTLHSAMFIPPASPATIQTVGALTVNGVMKLCSSYYTNVVDIAVIKNRLQYMIR